MARWLFLRVLLNSSSFSATLLSISWRTWLSSSLLSGPCSPPAQELPQPPQEHPGALPSPVKSSALLVKVMDGTSTISKLVKEILDFISKVLVLPLDNVKLFKSLILSSLQAVQLRAVVAAFILGSLNFSSNISSLSLPFSKDLVKVLASLLSDKSSSMNTLILHGDLIQVRGKSSLGLLNVGNLSLERINILLRLNNSSLKLGSSTLKLFNSGHTLSFISRLPELNLSLSLGKGLHGIRLAHMLILSLFL